MNGLMSNNDGTFDYPDYDIQVSTYSVMECLVCVVCVFVSECVCVWCVCCVCVCE